MKLDWIEHTRSFVLLVPRGEADLQVLMTEHGLDISIPDSTEATAVLFTKEPYAAASFAECATLRARAQMGDMLHEIGESWRATSEAHIRVPDDQELYAFQKADIEYALRRKHTLVGDQPGLGKTPVAIAFANEIGAARVLVICPANIRPQWVKRIREWTTMRWPYIIHQIRNSRDGTHPHAQWTVVSYDLARTEAIGKALAKGTYDLLILDEAHYLKTIDTHRTRAVFGGGHTQTFDALATRAGHILALTGTPLPNRPREAYTITRGLCWDALDWMSEDKFRFRFNPSRAGVTPDGRVYVDERAGRHGELQSRLRANFMVRHLKRDVLPQLKMPDYDVISLEATAAVKKWLKAESMLGIDPDNFDAHIPVMGQWSTVRMEMGLALTPQFIDYVDMLIDGGEEKLVVFAWHIEVLNRLEEAWQKHGVLRWRAGQSRQNDARKTWFIKDPKYKIALGNTLTMGTGTDGFQEVANHVLILEPDPVPGNNQQCIDRLDRLGQHMAVQADLFVAPGSVLEKILGRSLEKVRVTHAALDRRMS